MSLVTTCPACGTAFRVTPEQLSAHRGDVRCGQCQHIFNALPRLEEVMSSGQPLAAKNLGATRQPNADEPLIISSSAESMEELAPASMVMEATLEAFVPGSTTVDFELDFDEVAEQDVTPERVPEVVEAVTEAADAATDVPAASAINTSFMQPSVKRSMPLWLLTSLALLLLLAVAAQVAYFLRTEIAARYPPLRPWLELSCRQLGCTVELSRHADLLSIEDSDLQDDAEHAGILLLSSALYNHAHYAQAYPLLELTLTDTFDKPVLRRTFTPGEYLPAGTDVKAGIAANGEIRAHLPLSIEGEKPAGYRLYVRY